MATTFRPDEISDEILLKNFFKEVLADDAIATLVARKLAEKGFDERTRLVTSLCIGTNTHRNRWDTLIKKIK